MDRVIEGQQQLQGLGTIFTYSSGMAGIVERAVNLYVSSSLSIFPSTEPEFAYKVFPKDH